MASFRDAYIAGDAEVTALFTHPISDLFTSPPIEKPWDASLVKSIRDFNARYDHHPSFEGNEAVVITGQQPAILQALYIQSTKPSQPSSWRKSISRNTINPVSLYFGSAVKITTSRKRPRSISLMSCIPFGNCNWMLTHIIKISL